MESPNGDSSTIENRGLACQSCRKRRRKCNLETPCSNCVKYGIECVPIDKDLRRRRHSVGYLKSLENHIAHLEALVRELRPEKTDKTFPGADTERRPTSSPSPALTLSASATPVARGPQAGGSIYPTNSLALLSRRASKSQDDATTDTPRARLKNMSRSPFILRALSLFFKWLYPGHYSFIHRETFLSAFFGDPATKTYYCSEELVYAIAALGSILSDKSEELYSQSSQYYNIAKTTVLQKIFQMNDSSLVGSTPSSKLAIIQTLLCLAFYDIGNGENPLAWYSSGLAFRVAHEIGLHLNFESWSNVYEDELSVLDIEVRSRIYWGCYLADHLICVLFGRSTSLRLSNSTVPETDELPDVETGIEDYLYDSRVTLSMAKPLKELIVLSRITELFASKIFIQSESITQRSEHLLKFNSEVAQWRLNLPEQLRWSKELLKDIEDFNPTISYLWYHYYTVLLSYNKPFIEELNESKIVAEDTIEEICYLLKAFKSKFGGYEKSSIYMIYSAILAIQCCKTKGVDNRKLSELKEFLISPTLNFELGKKFIDKEVGSDPTDLFGTLLDGNDFALEYNFDFSLLNEIDTLIGGSQSKLT
ncbi:LANO_0C06876g1_1 [Lachancea nothofagi CBS 11611]|uniref:LANO_0C06876g1_1 n=1 Tax=Lachancea nothofagi CBS 11611 TaxID=1266666 RepID=A0A1G4J8J9_9SACH|nr:LANO_0C06876g1_1 [Lachancea nothofagi CBS 11611]